MADAKPLQAIPAGSYVMSITPFNRDGSIDEGAFREHIRWLAREKIGVFVASAHTGDGPLMTEPEIWRLYEIAAKELKGKTPVVAAGLEHPNAERNIRCGREAQARGMDWMHLYPATPGHSVVPSKKMQEVFYEEVLSAVPMPVTISSNFATGFEIPLEVHEALIDRWPQVVGFHKGHRDQANVERFLGAIAPRRPVLTGLSLGNFALGSSGELGAAANLTPRLCRSLFDAYMAKDMARAQRDYVKLRQISTAFAKLDPTNTRMPFMKAALNIMGRPGGYCRRPYLSLDDAGEKALARILDELEIRKLEGL